jgi:fructose-specific PTS system IIA-like component
MIALGVDEISVAPGEVLAIKALIAEADASRCRALLDAVLDGRDVDGVEQALGSWVWRDNPTIRGRFLDAEMIQADSDAGTKEEAIKEAVDLLFIAGRTERPREVEEAVWAREETYSTGLGHGFAVPHCKSDALVGPAMAILKLRDPVEWGSMDGKPVQVVILLAIPARAGADLHMKVFARLARKLMHDEFRDRLRAASGPAEVQAVLREDLGIE